MFKLSSLFESGAAPESTALGAGMKFPVELIAEWGRRRPDPAIACFVSLHCAHCIDLLPHLKNFADQFDGDFVLLCDGTAEEVRGIKQHLQFAFPFVTAEPFRRYAIKRTPFAYYLDADNVIIRAEAVNDYDDLVKFAAAHV